MRILTFNWHEAYICTLAKTGHAFDVVERQKGGSGVWFYETRPLPRNARIIKEATARALARDGAYDAVVCHNVQDLLWVRELPVAKVLVFHNMLRTEIALGGNTVEQDCHRAEVADLVSGTDRLRLVFISETKQRDWDLDGVVVPPGVDLSDYGGYRGDEARVLRVGNFMKRRDLMLGHTAQLAILGGRPSTLLGLNEAEEHSRVHAKLGRSQGGVSRAPTVPEHDCRRLRGRLQPVHARSDGHRHARDHDGQPDLPGRRCLQRICLG